jgi:uncharacterized protein (TIGR03118 family)
MGLCSTFSFAAIEFSPCNILGSAKMNHADMIHCHIRVGDRYTALLAALIVACTTLLPLPAAAGYVQQNLVSDLSGLAPVTDPNLVNPWGMSSSSTSPIWVSDNGTGVSTLYNGAGQPSSLVVTIPPPSGATGPAAPTGQVFNSTSGFQLNGSPARFIFATEDGTVSAWNGGTAATLEATTPNAVYKGLALATNGGSPFLYATNFHAGTIDVFDSSFTQTTLAGHFTDPNLPSGYAPFNIQNIGGNLYVTFAKQDSSGHDDVAGAGNGFIDVFDTNGNLVKRLVSNGPLDSPWGLALAPSDFGQFSNDLLVGNFGDGTIHAFDPMTGQLLGEIDDASGNPITIEGLWGLLFGNGGNGGIANELFFTAGIPGPDMVEDHGLFGDLTAVVPEPGSLLLLAVGLLGLVAAKRCRPQGEFS